MCIRVEAEPQPEDAQPEDIAPAGESSGPAAPEEEADDEYEPLWQGFGKEIG